MNTTERSKPWDSNSTVLIVTKIQRTGGADVFRVLAVILMSVLLVYRELLEPGWGEKNNDCVQIFL